MQEEVKAQIAADHASMLKATAGEHQQALAAVIARGKELKEVRVVFVPSCAQRR